MAPTSQKKSSLRKTPRVPVEGRFHSVHLRGPAGELAVVNLSEGGLGALEDASLKNNSVGDVLALALVVQGQAFTVQSRLAHRSNGIVGFEFKFDNESSVEFKIALLNYFSTELGALQLDSVPQENLKKSADGKSRWWTGGKRGDELFLVEDDGKLVEFHMTFLGNFVEWDSAKSRPRFGVVKLDPEEGPLSHKRSHLVVSSSTPVRDSAALAMRFVRAIPDIPEKLAAQILERLAHAES